MEDAAELGALSRVRALLRSAVNQVWLARPGIAWILPPSAGIHQLWITSGETTFRSTTTSCGTYEVPIERAPFG